MNDVLHQDEPAGAGSPSLAEGAGLPPDAPDDLAHLAQGRRVDAQGERDALDYLLGATYRPAYDSRVEYETPAGLLPLTFHLLALDGRTIDQIDERNRKGDGPFAKLDTETFNAELVLEATEYIEGRTGHREDPRSPDFRGEVPSPAAALELRFKYQPGLLGGLADEIRTISGYSPDRVGTAKRATIEAVGGS